MIACQTCNENVIIQNNTIADGIILVEASAHIRHYNRLDSKCLENANWMGNPFNSMPFIMVRPSRHQHHYSTCKRREYQSSGMTFD